MYEKLFFLLIVSGTILLGDAPQLKRFSRKVRIIYGMLTVLIVYLSIVYVMDLGWPSLDELVHSVFSKPSHFIVDVLKVPM